MKILVTGGLGFIGSHTVVSLLEAGYEVIIIDNLSNSSLHVLEGIAAITQKTPTFCKLDLRETENVSAFFETHKNIAGVIHFASSKAVGESVENPLLYYHNNISTLITLLQEMQKHQINNLIFSSSCTVYGEPDKLPITEEAPIKPALSPYGNTKQIGEEIIQDTCKSATAFKSIALRYFNPIGAHPSAKIGELPIGTPQNLIPYITQTAIGKRKELSVFGNDYPTPDGTCVRDYIHVLDLAEAHIAALKRLIAANNKQKFEVFNIGTGSGNSVLEIIKTFEKVTSKKLPYKFAERREGDVIANYAETQKANHELGWETKRSLDEALLSAWEWEQAYAKNNPQDKKTV